MNELKEVTKIISELLDANNLRTELEIEQAMFLGDELEVLRHAQAICRRYTSGTEA